MRELGSTVAGLATDYVACMQLSVSQYDQLEHAITNGTRLQLRRRGSEFLVIPERLRLVQGREQIAARHPSTGALLEIYLDELDAFEIVR